MVDTNVTNRNHLGFFADLRLGPKTLGDLADLSQIKDLSPNWNSFETGLSVKDDTAKWNLGFHFGSNFSEHGSEAGIILSPDHAGYPSFRTKLGILWAKEGSGDLNVTPVSGLNFSIPTLKFGDNALGIGLRPFAEMEFAFGFDADPVARGREQWRVGVYPDIYRLSAGLQFIIGDTTSFKEDWNDRRAMAVVAEEVAILYPMIGMTNVLGALQSVFMDYPHKQFPYLLENKFFPRKADLIFDPSSLLKINPGQIEEFMSATIKQGIFLGALTGQLMSMDSSIISASKRGGVDASIPLSLLVAKGIFGALALGVGFTGEDHPGEFPAYGGHSQKEIDETILKGDTRKKLAIARDFTEQAPPYFEKSKNWLADYRSRGAQYLGHSLLLQSGIAALDYGVDLNNDDERMGLYLLICTGGLLMATGGYAFTPFVDTFDHPFSPAQYYTQIRVETHVALLGTALFTYSANEILKLWGINTF